VHGGNVIIELDPDGCADLLASAPVGRLAVMVDGHPEIFPVNHVYERETGGVVFPSNTGTKLHAALGTSEVAFEADGISDDGSRGWSVLVVGHAEEVTEAETIARLSRGRDRLWRSGEAARWVRIVPSKMTGRRICGADRRQERDGRLHAAAGAASAAL